MQRAIWRKKLTGTLPNSRGMNSSWVASLMFSWRHRAGNPAP